MTKDKEEKFLSIEDRIYVKVEHKSNINDVLVDGMAIAKLIDREVKFKFNNSEFVIYPFETMSELKERFSTHEGL